MSSSSNPSNRISFWGEVGLGGALGGWLAGSLAALGGALAAAVGVSVGAAVGDAEASATGVGDGASANGPALARNAPTDSSATTPTIPASGGIQPGSIGRWLRVPRRAIGCWRPGSTLTWNGRWRSGPNGNGSSTSTRTANSTRASGATTARGGMTASLRRRSGSSAMTATSEGALPRLTTMTW